MSRLTRVGTAEPVSRDQILRHARGQGNANFSCSADHEQDWQPYPVDPYSAIIIYDDHTYIHTYIRTYSFPERLWAPCFIVFFALTDRAFSFPFILDNEFLGRGFQSDTWSAGHENIRGTSCNYCINCSEIIIRKEFHVL